MAIFFCLGGLMTDKVMLLPHAYPWGFSMNGNSHNESRPSIVLNRTTIRELANYDKDQIIEHLYQCVRQSESQRLEFLKERRRDEISRFVPMRRGVSGLVYFMRSSATRLIKIGCTTNIDSRRKSLQSQHKCKLEIIFTYESDDIYVYEHWFHDFFSARNVHGEWFNLSDKDLSAVNWRVNRDAFKRGQEERRRANAIPF